MHENKYSHTHQNTHNKTHSIQYTSIHTAAHLNIQKINTYVDAYTQERNIAQIEIYRYLFSIIDIQAHSLTHLDKQTLSP